MIITSPTDRWLRVGLEDCSSSLVVSSPYIGDYFRQAIEQYDGTFGITVLTRTLLTDFASRASNLDAVYALAKRAGGVLSLSTLHAKVYVIDNKRALVTSASATYSGMLSNRECGVEIKDQKVVAQLRQQVLTGFGSSARPELWTTVDLEDLRRPIEALRAALPRPTRAQLEAFELPARVQLRRRQYVRLVESFSGWLRLAMEGISTIRADTFTMNEVIAACGPRAAAQFPNNRHVREKLRQQMQRLRDLGLVLFLGRGRYQRVVTLA
jgi:hypothetical protein